jgi:hypothetical protein
MFKYELAYIGNKQEQEKVSYISLINTMNLFQLYQLYIDLSVTLVFINTMIFNSQLATRHG